jgi:hypothetical protein
VSDETVSEPELADDPARSNDELTNGVVAPATGWHTGDAAEPIEVVAAPEPVVALTSAIDPAKSVADRAAADRVAAEHAAADATFERESTRRRDRVLYGVVILFALAIVVPMASIGVRVAMTAPTYMAPLLIQPVIVLTSVWLGARLGKRK